MEKMIKTSRGIQTVPLESEHLFKRRIFIEGDITNQTASDFFKQMLELNEDDNSRRIDVYINSHGGSIPAGLAIIDAIRLSKAPIRTVCLSEAFSMAAVIFASGTADRLMFEHSRLMLHQPQVNAASGSVDSIYSVYQSMNECRKQINEILSSVCRKSIDEINLTTAEDRFFNGTQAIEFGLADGIADFNVLVSEVYG